MFFYANSIIFIKHNPSNVFYCANINSIIKILLCRFYYINYCPNFIM